MSTASVLLYTSPVFGVVLGRVLYREDVTPTSSSPLSLTSLAACLQ